MSTGHLLKYSNMLVDEISPGATIGLKVERILLALSYCAMLATACSNVWKFLIKKKMWKSFPMTVAYVILVCYSILCIIYEMFMCSACSEHDCLVSVLALDLAGELDPEHNTNGAWGIFVRNYKDTCELIFHFWRLK